MKVKAGLDKLYQELTPDKSGLKQKFVNFPPQEFVAYTAIRGECLISENLSLFEDEYRILKNKLMKQWFSEYEAILEEACYRRLWHELYECRREFHAENLEIAPGFIVHHLEFGSFINSLASLTSALVSNWFYQHSAKWKNVLYPFALPETHQSDSFKVVYNHQTRTNIEGSRQTYVISSLQEKYGWPYIYHAKRKFLNTEPRRQRQANIQSTNEKASA
ncbi:hypothetical protein CROQUDRAFT_137164 [Cronartium quercuum f. sp. fusiforme G11]|uniref:Uncharacterized protein n=1 Tax=Cronartium quercuum f. sp. fusiforme G11 TaxID=708437 RepID=A0A9P6T530_9BASI|nr:hypothetical protein CROQUDRAFT_137164 [Cronartium quercuum f. sp. fusiforme G11]